VARALIADVEMRTQGICGIFFKNSLGVHPAVNGYPSLFRAGEGDGGAEKIEASLQ